MLIFDYLITGLLFCSLLMTVVYFISTRLNFYSLVDAAWAYGIGLITTGAFLFTPVITTKKIIVLSMALAWSLRLGTYLSFRLIQYYPIEDRRYQNLKKIWSKLYLFLFFQFQGISQIIFCIPFFLVLVDSDDKISYSFLIGLTIFVIGLIGETIADRQLQLFKMQKENINKVFESGLWKYSRHPNYFFEWLAWCGVAMVAIESPYGYVGLISPISMFLTLNYFTGIPAVEAQSILTKYSVYKNYQNKTNSFFPGFRK